MTRMRTIAECARMLKQADPQTAITQNAIRTKVLTGEIPHVKVGRKRLIDYDQMLEQLKSPPVQPTPQPEHGTVRQIEY